MSYLGIGLVLAGLIGIGMGYMQHETEGYIIGALFILAGLFVATRRQK